jgi:hypothetical protein
VQRFHLLPKRLVPGQGVACVTVNVCPAIVTIPTLSAPTLSAIEMNTLPLPLPLAPETIVMNGAVVAAVHAQPPGAVTVTIRSALELLIDTVLGEIE